MSSADSFADRAWVVASEHRGDTRGILTALHRNLRPGEGDPARGNVQQLQADITNYLNPNRPRQARRDMAALTEESIMALELGGEAYHDGSGGCVEPRDAGSGQVTVAVTSKDGSGTAEGEKEDDDLAFNPFGFVTDNPSNRSAIQLPAVPAEDGNVGQMLYRIEDKGREHGVSDQESFHGS